MVLCPVALAVGCRKCPIFSGCPVKSLIGDYKPPPPVAPQVAAKRTAKSAPKATATRKKPRSKPAK
ncbi:hypothetical protein ELE36_10020 [Pseudolysobacter antarcticus]|uniref:Uncharacterized protein n=1 Tax=Pseudolysobacter antarcticus TaxID=2511995 RepID=A0A411HJK8_9GAMM|nr:hypothetical protein ELE36_10020 [Pseudolysobacter antarcticus]